eukprot:m.428118 g.428118  ORF g.428118 m.428118 type:complete len:587 (-) comp21371_c0_seq3:193-1953(-)
MRYSTLRMAPRRVIGILFLVVVQQLLQTHGETQVCTSDSSDRNLVHNGGFEIGSQRDFTLVCSSTDYLCQSSCVHSQVSCGAVPSWTVYHGNVNFGNYESECPISSCAAEGDNFLDICGVSPGAMYQNVTVDVGATYRLSLQYAAHPGSDTCDTYYSRYFNADARVVIGGAAYRISHPSTTSFSTLGWTSWSVDFTPTESVVRLDISSLEFNCGCVFFDNIKIQRLNCTAYNSTLGTADSEQTPGAARTTDTESTQSVAGVDVSLTSSSSSTSSTSFSSALTDRSPSTPHVSTRPEFRTSAEDVVIVVGASDSGSTQTRSGVRESSTIVSHINTTQSNADQLQSPATGRAKGTHVAFVSAVVVAAVSVSGLLFIVVVVFRHKRNQRAARRVISSMQCAHVANPTYECRVDAVSTDDFTDSPAYEAHVMDGINRMLSNESAAPAPSVTQQKPRAPTSTPAVMTVGEYTVPIMARARRATYGELKYEDDQTAPSLQWTNTHGLHTGPRESSAPYCSSTLRGGGAIYEAMEDSVCEHPENPTRLAGQRDNNSHALPMGDSVAMTVLRVNPIAVIKGSLSTQENLYTTSA